MSFYLWKREESRTVAVLSVSISAAAGQPDPTNVTPINFTVVFSTVVMGFASNDILFTGSTVGGTLAAVISGTGPYNIAVSGMTGTGSVAASVRAGAVMTAAGVQNPASNVATVSFVPEVTPPSVPTGLVGTPQ